MQMKWRLPQAIPAEAERELALVPSLLRPVLYARGIHSREQAQTFLAKPLSDLHDPFELPDMQQAVELVQRAVEGGRRIVVYGDYDADGVTGTALLVQALRGLGADVDSYTPDRFREGYGLNLDAVEELAAGFDLMITVDCGTRALAEIHRAAALGMEVIVTDHHHPGPELPAADALVNPRRDGARYPFPDLAGVGLAYKLAQAVAGRLGRDELPQSVLELVALGTVADLAPLVGENRILVAEGLKQLNRCESTGLQALMEAARLRPGRLTAANIAFGLGPRLNAAGRMKSARLALELLLTEEQEHAQELAQQLERMNSRRQEETRRTVELARSRVLDDGRPANLLFAVDEDFHEGVVGLAASRLVEEFYRPAIVARRADQLVKGSARSIPQFHITDALEACRDLLVHYGGHAAAAGFTARTTDVPELVRRLRVQAAQTFEGEAPQPELHVDAVVEPAELDEGLLQQLEAFEPFGQGNEPPVFAAFGAELTQARTVGREGAHLKLTLRAGNRVFDAIGFRMGDRAPDLASRVDLAFHYEWNEYRGYISPQLRLLDLRAAESTNRPRGT